ncbi:MAG: hypothetical protein K2I63_01745, partial [Helicobacter sp.]|nr:hypothetical protein [Helicobacter sp.]
MGKKEFLETYVAKGGKITSLQEYLQLEGDESESILLLGGFICSFLDCIPHLQTKQKQVFLLHPLNFNPSPSVKQFLYEVKCEEAVVALLADSLITQVNEEVKTFKDMIDIGYLASESNFAEEEVEIIARSFAGSVKKTFILGRDFYECKNGENIARILALLSENSEITV